ncbi:glycosyltransferase family 2 protein [Celeribacter sp. PS-C1]|uniref:glycosyltransferase family 2 protein n=1 Tax=Celeribacter sp. PS-C1 TaxID=2820813 RepID=UPI001C68250B|nr:glycosyltransferase family 2 protein [Celeribacter sp. PS-C1]MBW6416305.1 glycosyltransferase family 2 protein [Celeribacter sp. PS-C1]
MDDASILCVACLRNEVPRLPYFLEYYRRLGVTHFLFVDNDSNDGARTLLTGEPDVSLWSTSASYKDARFGLDWTTWLQMKYARGKWCLTLDADELLVFPGDKTQTLRDLTLFMDETGQQALGALMLDLYPKGPIDQVRYHAGQDPLEVTPYFDPAPYRAVRQVPKDNLWVQGGARERVFFADDPRRGPTLNKLPLVKWHWRYVYINSTHAMLPSVLNHAYDGPGGACLSGVLLHTKFLPVAIEKSREEKTRKQHFAQPDAFGDYYDAVIKGPDLWHEASIAYEGAEQLEALGLMSRGSWRE